MLILKTIIPIFGRKDKLPLILETNNQEPICGILEGKLISILIFEIDYNLPILERHIQELLLHIQEGMFCY